MTDINNFPFFEIDAPLGTALPLDRWLTPSNIFDMAQPAHRLQIDKLRRSWKAWPYLPDLSAVVDTALIGLETPGPLLTSDPGPAPGRLGFGAKIWAHAKKVRFEAKRPTSLWIRDYIWQPHANAFRHAKQLKLTSGKKPIYNGTDGQKAERNAWKAVVSIVNEGSDAGVPWSHGGVDMPPTVRVVALHVQLLCPMPNPPTVGLPDMIYAIDQVIVFQKLSDPPHQSDVHATNSGGFVIVGVEIDGGEKWSEVLVEKSYNYWIAPAVEERARSRHLLGMGMELFRIHSDDCLTEDRAYKQMKLLFNAVSARAHGGKPMEYVHVTSAQ